MNLLTFWVLATYALGYCAFFVAAFDYNETFLAGEQPRNTRTFWLALAVTTGVSLGWPWFLYRYWRRHARS